MLIPVDRAPMQGISDKSDHNATFWYIPVKTQVKRYCFIMHGDF